MPQPRRRRTVLLAAAALAGLAGAGTLAAGLRPRGRPGPAPGPFFAEGGVALKGYDPVAYFAAGAPTLGDPAIAAELGGVVWRFASEAHRARFLEDPARYLPRYGGWCAWAVATQGEPVPVDPHAWRVVDGKLYLNYDAAVQRQWEADVPGFVARADAVWPGLEARLAAGRGPG